MLGDSMRRRRGGRKPARESHAREPRPGPRMRPLRWIGGGLLAIAAAFGLGYLVATTVLFPRPALAGDEVAVPDLVGLELQDARAALDAVGLGLGETREVGSPERSQGVVLAQAPVAGQRLRPGASVRVGVSAGAPTVVVPDLVGMRADGAEVLARQVGLTVERQAEEADAPAGQVLRTEPVAGARVEPPARLVVWVSSGPAAVDTTQVAPPDSGWFFGEPQEEGAPAAAGQAPRQDGREPDDTRMRF